METWRAVFISGALLTAWSACSADTEAPAGGPGGHVGDPGFDAGGAADATSAPGPRDGGAADASQESPDAAGDAPSDAPPPAPKAWVDGYYAGWTQDTMTPDLIDYAALTHVVHFGLWPNLDGTLDTTSNLGGVAHCAPAVQAAHAGGAKISITVGGAASQTQFEGAASAANRATFVSNLVAFMRQYGYDGIDVSWQPSGGGALDRAGFQAFVTALRAALDKVSPRPMLTAAVGATPDDYLAVVGALDQINVLTYDMSGAYAGWITWHSSPLANGGYTFPSTGGPLPSIDLWLQAALGAGVPAAKLGFGVAFHGQVWTGGIVQGTTNGVTQPRQQWSKTPTVQSDVAYADIMSKYFSAAQRTFDPVALVPYLSIDAAGSANDRFVSYEDEQSIAEKGKYLAQKGLGGVVVWQLAEGYRAAQPAGQRDPLLQAVKTAFRQ